MGSTRTKARGTSPVVAGTFKEREGFPRLPDARTAAGPNHQGQLEPRRTGPRPFSGSATTVSVAKKLERRFVAFDISEEYIERGLKRLEAIQPGEKLDGAEEPKVSAPSTQNGKRLTLVEEENPPKPPKAVKAPKGA